MKFVKLPFLTPLTSNKNHYDPTVAQRAAFEDIRKFLIRDPLFSNLNDNKAEKFMFVDAASSTYVLGCTLAQRITGHEKAEIRFRNFTQQIERFYIQSKPEQIYAIFR